MPNSENIINHKSLSINNIQTLEQKAQENDLSYLSSIAFEQFNISDSDINELNLLMDKKTKGNQSQFNTIFISVLCGLLVGISLFFVIFRKNENHPSILQSLDIEKSDRKLNNSVTATDTLFPIIEPKPIEHYHTIVNGINEAKQQEVAEILPNKPTSINIPEAGGNEDIVFQFTPNAPIIFIHNLKVTNYRLYYFKNNEIIDVSINGGLPAQYGNKADIEETNNNRFNSFFAHKIIQKAMLLFDSKHIANCIEELSLLYDFNHEDANAQFYLGMCYYEIGKYKLAAKYFEENLNNENNIFHQESEFYQALCFLNSQQKDRALSQLQIIANNKGFYSVKAKEIIEKQPK